jgi:exosortase D (VPLPA-CTERM-specific)
MENVLHRFPLMLALAAAIAAALWQHAAAAEMWRTWSERPEYSHGMLLPLLAAAILWYRRELLTGSTGTGSWGGVALLAAGAGIAWLGNMASLHAISQYGLAVMVSGILLAWMGLAAARKLWIVFALLLLAVPPPNFILNALSFDMQLLSSKLGVLLVIPFGTSVFVEGNVIDLGDQQLQVAEACDGLRYLFPLLTIGFLMAYFFRAAWWKRVAIFLFSLPLAIAMNALRVALIILMVERWGLGMAEGLFHDVQGWVMFMLSTGALLMFARWIAGPDAFALTARPVDTAAEPPASQPGPHLANRSLATTAALSVALCAFGLIAPARVDAVPARAHLSEWPMQTGHWQGRRGALDRVYLDVLKLDDYLLADFSDGARGPINLYVAYYQSQRSGASAHSPRSCIPGGGWQIRSIDEVSLVTAGSGGRPVSANRVLIEHGLQKQIVYYWFEQRGRNVTNEYLVKWYIFWDAVTRNRTDGALVRISAAVPAGQSVEDVDAMLAEFAGVVVPRLEPYVPG